MAKIDNLKDFFKILADVIREKLDSNDKYAPNDMPAIIEGISKESSGTFNQDLVVLTGNGINEIKRINVFQGVTDISKDAFSLCKSLEIVSLPETLITIGENAFYECSKLNQTRGNNDNTFIIPESVQKIDKAAFYNCTSLENINFKCKDLTVGLNSFSGTKWLNNQSDGAVYSGPALLMYKGGIQDSDVDFVIKDGTTSLTESCLRDKSRLRTLKIPSSVKYIGVSAVSNCSDIKEITVYGDVYLSIFAFSLNPALEKVTINNLKECGVGALRGCSSLTKLILYNDDPFLFQNDTFNENFHIYAKPEMIEKWKKESNWSVAKKYVLPLTELENA